ncbi:MAG: tRNA (adenosine(37)-N6)-threonylcarbamoyltransferase complex dimerization subunit type 1 TsaB [Alistipes sp.]|nr:tRNA (adenosine(37)-N6)-threonylcarbamoyltransferase complex dimerization subunit type 1 TsaB [Candidatus Minthomonas equi]
MNRILLLETSTVRCSVALAEGMTIVSHRETDVPKAHASKLSPFVDEMLKETSLSMKDIDAVAVSGGPGSYTGLRVGVSTAKGLCFGAGKPLISVGTLEILAWQAAGMLESPIDAIIVPMVDARRMEVYTQTFSASCEALSECEAKVLDEDSFSKLFACGKKIVFVGDGVEKYHLFLKSHSPEKTASCIFLHCCPDASAMLSPSLRKFASGDFEDSAYYEPFYLKEFVAGISRKSVL